MKEFKKFVKIYLKSFCFIYVFCSFVLLYVANFLMFKWGIMGIGRCVLVLLIIFSQSLMFVGLIKIENVFRQLEFEKRIKKIKEIIENEKNMEFNEQNKF